MIWVSLGENCLPDDVLKRHGLKSFSTPFSSARSNIDYAIQADAESFRSLLSEQHIVRHKMGNKTVLRNEMYSSSPNLFDALVSRGFEFTHHDVIDDISARNSYERKISRWEELKRCGDAVTFLYHHRVTSPSSTSLIKPKVAAFLKQFDPNQSRSLCLILVQNLVHERSLTLESDDKAMLTATINAPTKWEGDDSNVLFGRIDDDLISLALTGVGRHWAAREQE